LSSNGRARQGGARLLPNHTQKVCRSLAPRCLALPLLILPRAQGAAQQHEVSPGIGVVVGNEQRLAQDRLPLAVRDRREQVRGRVRDQVLHRLQIGAEGGEAPLPGAIIRRSIALGPVPVRKLWRDVLWVAAELEDVPLGYAQ